MKILRTLSRVFPGLGLAMLVGALFMWNSTRGFVARAHTAPGRVIELLEVRDSDGGSSTWKPRVSFTAPSGEPVPGRLLGTPSSRWQHGPGPDAPCGLH